MTDITPYLEEKLIKVLKMQANLPKYQHYFTELKTKRYKRRLYPSATGCVDEIKKKINVFTCLHLLFSVILWPQAAYCKLDFALIC